MNRSKEPRNLSNPLHEDYLYLKQSTDIYQPRTQNTAFMAVQQGLLPPAAFIYKAVNVRPIFEEPYDLTEIDRILAKQDLGIKILLQLIHILGKLIDDPDPETALFAAESINTIEHRYNTKIQELKASIAAKNGNTQENLRSLSFAYIEFAQINQQRNVLKNFYLREAWGVLRKFWTSSEKNSGDYRAVVYVLLELGLHDQCRTFLEAALELRPDLEEVLLILSLNTAFRGRDHAHASRIIHRLSGLELSSTGVDFLNFWESRTDHLEGEFNG